MTVTGLSYPLTEAIEALPLANTPEVFGLHSNAEIGYYTQAARDMWAHLLELQPQTGKAQGPGLRSLAGPCFRSSVPLYPLEPGGTWPGPLLSLKSVLVAGESSSGISRDDYIGNVAKDIENKMPKVFDLDQVRKHLGFSISPTSVVLLQELERFNKLVVRMTKSLAELQRVSGHPLGTVACPPSPCAMGLPDGSCLQTGPGGRGWHEQ